MKKPENHETEIKIERTLVNKKIRDDIEQKILHKIQNIPIQTFLNSVGGFPGRFIECANNNGGYIE